MSISNIPDPVKFILWAKAAGRCQYEGCPKILYLEDFTKAEFNQAYTAHIIADVPTGPRGDAVLSKKLKKDISNLMLLCDAHHRLIDKVDIAGHPVERLCEMKQRHEKRMELLTAIQESKRSHVLMYGANIGKHETPLTKSEAHLAMIPERYPAEANPLELGMKASSLEDRNEIFWKVEEEHLQTRFQQRVSPLKGTHEVQHFSVFAMAPQPLLIRLGTLLSDLYPADVYQRHREPATWKWQDKADVEDFELIEPTDKSGIPALVFALSATINDDRITTALENKASIWKVMVSKPGNNFLRKKDLLEKFRMRTRHLLNEIKAHHGEYANIHVFPAMPVSTAIEFGRVWMPKADLPLIIYDQNSGTGGFTKAIEIKNK
ncbi:MAG: hypothetical protein FD123_409 [Bacteroidetes bacterium]|nr:MAG: hypothetical protein FD123_409 [Bacteroidota bacterium]